MQVMHNFPETLAQYLDKHLKERTQLGPNHYVFHLEPSFLMEAASWLYHNKISPVRLVTLTAMDNRENQHGFQVYILFLVPKLQLLLTLMVELPTEKPEYPAISPLYKAAEWMEREIHDLFGIVPKGMSLLPLVLHRDWPRNLYPFRRDFPINHIQNMAEIPHVFDMPDAEGIHQVAVGPIHAGIIEPGHMRFAVTGEQIHQFDAQLFYTHKGIEKMAEGKEILDVLQLAEHVCGMCSYAHSVAFCQSVEALAQISPPERVLKIRTIGLELERISSHLADLTAICAAGGLGYGSAQMAYIREKMMQTNHLFTGHRFLRNLNTIGGLKRYIAENAFIQVQKNIQQVKILFREIVDIILKSDSFLDRLEGSGKLSTQQALELGIVGPAARACGINRDIRQELPYALYPKFFEEIPAYHEGDVFTRAKVRIDEVFTSITMIEELLETQIILDRMGEKPIELKLDIGKLPLYQPSVGIVESAKGELVHWLMIGPRNKVFRWHVQSASFMNWRGMIQATMGDNIVPDAPLVNKSFNLCYACVDR